MIYYANPCTEQLKDLMSARRLGCITTPDQGNIVFADEWDAIADNGCFISPDAYAAGKRWAERSWLDWLVQQPRSFRFVVCPDVFYPDGSPCHDETMDRWAQYGGMLARWGFTPAFVVQSGCTADTLPDDASVIFVGGDDDYKLGGEVKRIGERCRAEGRWLHWGRVNSEERMIDALESGADSCDGTYVVFGPDTNTPKLLRKLERAHNRHAARFPVPCDFGVGAVDRPRRKRAPRGPRVDPNENQRPLFKATS